MHSYLVWLVRDCQQWVVNLLSLGFEPTVNEFESNSVALKQYELIGNGFLSVIFRF